MRGPCASREKSSARRTLGSGTSECPKTTRVESREWKSYERHSDYESSPQTERGKEAMTEAALTDSPARLRSLREDKR
jgi:hypothetical protein